MTAQRIEVEIGALVVDDPALARGRELADAVETELSSLLPDRELTSMRAGRLSARVDGRPSAASVGRSVARTIGELAPTILPAARAFAPSALPPVGRSRGEGAR